LNGGSRCYVNALKFENEEKEEKLK
jgi:hypothetical protein